MPLRAPRPCKTPGCPALVDPPEGYCADHIKNKPGENRLTAWQRGYDGQWQRFREWYIRRHPLCVDCLAEDIVTAVEEVHHIQKVATHPEMKLDESNCMPLCKAHHSIRTSRGE